MEKVIIYGMGINGQRLMKSVFNIGKDSEIEILALMDKAEIKASFPYPVLYPDSLVQLSYDYIVVTSEQYYEEIKNELTVKYAIQPEKIILWRTWLYQSKNHYCCLCGHTMPVMLKFGQESPAFHSKKIVGGGIRWSRCVFCGSLDRNRWVQYVLEHKTDIYTRLTRVLHFAPEPMIREKLRAEHCGEYITADIDAEKKVDRIEDITNISFSNDTFDFIICNHVMEHIKAEAKAFSELKRCLKTGGKVIFSVPVCWEQKTAEDDAVTSEEQRLIEYGQKDHVRLYGNDLKQRLETHGFKVSMYRVDQELTKEEIKRMCLIPEDTVWILEK